ncbi:MAG: protein-L-isoaspartate O-methyltransferase [Patescibacteria group bacterium]
MKDKLIKSLINIGVLKTPRIIDAFRKVDRIDFIPEKLKDLAYEDEALPIGHGQTISQPYTVAFMLELLEPKSGDRILDIGGGSGWQSALLAEIAGDSGRIYSIEINQDVFEIGKTNIAKYPDLSKRIGLYCQNANNGLPKIAKDVGGFDKIIAAAEVKETPSSWRRQLKIEGRLVYPKDISIFLEIKKSDNNFETIQFPGFAFVPFINN